jgi:hypothetical protein
MHSIEKAHILKIKYRIFLPWKKNERIQYDFTFLVKPETIKQSLLIDYLYSVGFMTKYD